MSISIQVANYHDPQQAQDILYLMDSYARDPMGGGEALAEDVKANLVRELAKIEHAFTVLCYVEGKAAGLINCFETFSTFKCKPLINIHDVVVLTAYRGQGISQKMLMTVETVAKEKNCCKLTLEVLEGNKVARNAYLKYGFGHYQLDPAMGNALFFEKLL